jgi:hypothetical protein
MRLAAQLRGGFYPAPPQAVAHAATFLRPPARGPFTLLDPLCGPPHKGSSVAEDVMWSGLLLLQHLKFFMRSYAT